MKIILLFVICIIQTAFSQRVYYYEFPDSQKAKFSMGAYIFNKNIYFEVNSYDTLYIKDFYIDSSVYQFPQFNRKAKLDYSKSGNLRIDMRVGKKVIVKKKKFIVNTFDYQSGRIYQVWSDTFDLRRKSLIR
ncbi:MAG: hypothetical protein SFY32_11705 [Bacteroidota bacterium]|nr:hypothetical protein [Bacteroidota bacterium]